MRNKLPLIKKFPLLTAAESTLFYESLLFLHVLELQMLCVQFCFFTPVKETKMILIDRIMHFIETGTVLEQPKIPAVSRAARGAVYQLAPTTLMLKGAYKNDLQTRLFFKHLIGDYFHFTAFGIDWLKARWLEGNPPTYQEFADMWVVEYKCRKEEGSKPKEEWAYINFIQDFMRKHPEAPREVSLAAWEKERARHVEIVKNVLSELFS